MSSSINGRAARTRWHACAGALLVCGGLLLAGPGHAADRAQDLRSVDQDVQALKKQLVDLNRDLSRLEEELLYPASTQVAVFLSLDVGTFFALDSVTRKVDDGRVIGFGGRVLGDGTPKYLNSPETPVFHKGRELYGLYEARQSVKDWSRVLLVEGYMDTVALAQYGIRNVVATLGTAVTPEHLDLLFRNTSEVVFCFDGDRAGRQAAWRGLENALPAMHDGRQVRFIFLPEGEDPDTLVRKIGAEEFSKAIAAAVPLSEFMIEQLGQQIDLRSLDGQAKHLESVRPLIRHRRERPVERLGLVDVSCRKS